MSSPIASRTIHRSRGMTSPYADPRPLGRQPDERRDVRVAAHDPVEGHDVRRVDGGRAAHEIALDELDPVEQPGAARLFAGDLEVGRRAVDEHGMTGAGAEQLLIDDPDPATDVEQR